MENQETSTDHEGGADQTSVDNRLRLFTERTDRRLENLERAVGILNEAFASQRVAHLNGNLQSALLSGEARHVSVEDR